MQIGLNLASRPYVNLGPLLYRLRQAMAVLAVLALALAGGLYAFHSQAEAARAREHAVDLEIRQQQAVEASYQQTLHAPENDRLLKQTASLNQLFNEKAFSWTTAMEDLEMVLPSGVQLSTLEPERTKDGRIVLHLRVNGPRDHVLELVENLERSHRFMLPRIVGETAENNNQGPNQRMEPISASNRFNFDLLSDYNPSAPREQRFVERLGPVVAQPQQLAGAPPMVRALAPARPQPEAMRPQPVPNRQPVMQHLQPLPQNPNQARPGLPPGMTAGRPGHHFPGRNGQNPDGGAQ